MNRILLAGLMFLNLLSACSGVEEENQTYVDPEINRKVEKNLGQVFYLSKVKKQGEPDSLPEKGVFTLSFNSQSTLSGNMKCHRYEIQYVLKTNGVLSIQDSVVRPGTCTYDPPFEFERLLNVKFEDTKGELELHAQNGSWIAHFIRY